MRYRDELHKLIDSLGQQYDEMQVQARLAKSEAKVELEKLGVQLDALKIQGEQIKHVANDAGQDILAAGKLLGGEIKAGIERVRRML